MTTPTRNALLAFAMIGLVDGFISARVYPDVPFNRVSIAAAVVSYAVAFFWYRSDYIRRGYKPSRILSVGVIAMPLFALPYYLFRTRGLKDGAVATGCVLLLCVGYGMVQHIGATVAVHGGPNYRLEGP